jgi:xeroderma pigmentosum group C-complementing protein
MPRNIEDFKGHPIYILERHLRRDEVIHPKREVGKVNTGSKSNSDAKIESVYRRQDVHIVKSMDKWFRLGRQVRTSEMPLKRVRPRLQRAQKDDSEGMAEVNDATGETIGLYAAYQTELYVPPAVRNGRIEKNPFGNIDIYVRTMIPRGAVHIKSKYARQAARIIGVDFADAVTGFRFKSMHGTAVIDGVVVAKEYKEAMVTLLEGLAYAQEQAIQQQRTSEGLALWNRFLVGLRIVERVKTYRHEDEETDEDEDEEVALQEFAKGMQQYQDRHFEYTDGEVVEVIEAPSVEYNSQMSVDNEDNEQKKEEENVKEEKAQQEIEQQYESAFESQTDGDAEASMQKAHIDQGDGCGERLHEEEQTYSDEQSAGDNEDHNETWEQQSIMMGEDPEDEDAEPEWLDC